MSSGLDSREGFLSAIPDLLLLIKTRATFLAPLQRRPHLCSRAFSRKVRTLVQLVNTTSKLVPAGSHEKAPHRFDLYVDGCKSQSAFLKHSQHVLLFHWRYFGRDFFLCVCCSLFFSQNISELFFIFLISSWQNLFGKGLYGSSSSCTTSYKVHATVPPSPARENT